MPKDNSWSDLRLLTAFAALTFLLQDAGHAVRAHELSRGFAELHAQGYDYVEIFVEILEEHDGTYGDGSEGHYGPNIRPIKVPASCQRPLDRMLAELQERIAA